MQCQYIDAKGKRCMAEAVRRLFYSVDHPFDFVDVCAEHVSGYKHWNRSEDISSYEMERELDSAIGLTKHLLQTLREKGIIA